MHMSNYRFTVGELLNVLHEQVALGTDPDTPVYVRQNGTNSEIQTVGVGGSFISLYVDKSLPPLDELSEEELYVHDNALPPNPTDESEPLTRLERSVQNSLRAEGFEASDDTVREASQKVLGKRKNPKHDWKRVDWSRSTGYLAKKLGVDISQVSRARRKYAPRTVRPLRKKA